MIHKKTVKLAFARQKTGVFYFISEMLKMSPQSQNTFKHKN